MVVAVPDIEEVTSPPPPPTRYPSPPATTSRGPRITGGGPNRGSTTQNALKGCLDRGSTHELAKQVTASVTYKRTPPSPPPQKTLLDEQQKQYQEHDQQSFHAFAPTLLSQPNTCLSIRRRTLPPQLLRRLLSKHQNLVSLDLTLTRISTLPQSLRHLAPTLRHLNLASNHLADIPVVILALSNLTFLNISNNHIVGPVPDGLALKLTALTEFVCYGNAITALPDTMACWSAMRRLIAGSALHGGNSLSKVPKGCFPGMLALEQLDLSNNRIRFLPSDIGHPRSRLTSLSLGYNYIEALPTSIGMCTALKYLNLERNLLCRLPCELGLLDELSVLNLSENMLCAVPEELEKRLRKKTMTRTSMSTDSMPMPMEVDQDGGGEGLQVFLTGNLFTRVRMDGHRAGWPNEDGVSSGLPWNISRRRRRGLRLPRSATIQPEVEPVLGVHEESDQEQGMMLTKMDTETDDRTSEYDSLGDQSMIDYHEQSPFVQRSSSSALAEHRSSSVSGKGTKRTLDRRGIRPPGSFSSLFLTRPSVAVASGGRNIIQENLWRRKGPPSNQPFVKDMLDNLPSAPATSSTSASSSSFSPSLSSFSQVDAGPFTAADSSCSAAEQEGAESRHALHLLPSLMELAARAILEEGKPWPEGITRFSLAYLLTGTPCVPSQAAVPLVSGGSEGSLSRVSSSWTSSPAILPCGCPCDDGSFLEAAPCALSKPWGASTSSMPCVRQHKHYQRSLFPSLCQHRLRRRLKPYKRYRACFYCHRPFLHQYVATDEVVATVTGHVNVPVARMYCSVQCWRRRLADVGDEGAVLNVQVVQRSPSLSQCGGGGEIAGSLGARLHLPPPPSAPPP